MFEFKCKKCKHIFTNEELPESPFEQVMVGFTENSALDENEKTAFFIEEVTKRVRCPKCGSTVYLTSFAGIDDFELDATSEPLVQLVKGAIDLVKKGRSGNIAEEYNEYAKEIVSELIWKPGTLIHFEDLELMKEAESALSIIWNEVSEDELFEEMISGGADGILVNIIGDYTERAKKLKPTLISVKPDKEISVYFQNAMDSWLFGLNSASVILCFSMLEGLLKQKHPTLLYKGDKILKDFRDLRNAKCDMKEFIDEIANKGHISEDTRKLAQGIRRLRNDVVHIQKQINSDEAYNKIMDTKTIMERLLG